MCFLPRFWRYTGHILLKKGFLGGVPRETWPFLGRFCGFSLDFSPDAAFKGFWTVCSSPCDSWRCDDYGGLAAAAGGVPVCFSLRSWRFLLLGLPFNPLFCASIWSFCGSLSAILFCTCCFSFSFLVFEGFCPLFSFFMCFLRFALF